MTHKLLITAEYGGFRLGEKWEEKSKVEEWLREQGYTEKQAEDIVLGKCPRDLPILHEAYEKFGAWQELRYVVIEHDCYRLTDHDGLEAVEAIVPRDYDEKIYATLGTEEEWKPTK